MERFVTGLATASALLGGLVVMAVVLMTSVSILGRALAGFGLGPVPGDFELVEAGIGFAVFAFLPIAQLRGGHATVKLFTNALPMPVNRTLMAIWEVLAALALALIAWRLLEGTRSKYGYGETTFLLQFPVWWGYAAALVPAGATVIVALWSAYDRVRAAVDGVDRRSVHGESNH